MTRRTPTEMARTFRLDAATRKVRAAKQRIRTADAALAAAATAHMLALADERYAAAHQVEDAILRACADIRQHWPHMLDAYLDAKRGGSSGGKGADDVTALDRILSERVDASIVVNGWARVIVEDRPVSHGIPDGHDMLGMCSFIERHARWFSGHEAAGDGRDELAEVARTCQRIAQPQRREWVSIGTCPLTLDNGETCGGTVRAWPEAIQLVDLTLAERRDRPAERSPSCDRCGTEGAVTWWERVMFPEAGDSHRLLRSDELPLMLHRAFGMVVTTTLLRQWVKRGVIVPAAKDDRGRSLYDRAAVVYAISKRKGA